MTALLQSGSLGEDVQARFNAAEKEMEAEVVDVVSEANNFRQGWGGWIFASASEMVGREKIKDVLSGIEKVRVDEGELGLGFVDGLAMSKIRRVGIRRD